MSKFIFYIPFYYTFKTRLINTKSRLAWVLSYIVPVTFGYLFFVQSINDILNVAEIVISVSIIYCAYEIGYIYNDCEVIKKEDKPTIRLNEGSFDYYERNKYKIYLLRVFLLCTLIGFALKFDFATARSLMFSSLAILTVYVFYNSLRSRWNIPLYSTLVFLRYFGFLVLVCEFKYLLLLWLLYPLCVTLEFASKPRFDYPLKWIAKNIDLYRLFYYLSTTILLIVIYSDAAFRNSGFIISAYFLVYRTFSYFFLSKKYRE